MAAVETVVDVDSETIATPIKVVLVGAVMALLEGVYDIVNANSYAGVIDGIEISTMDVIGITAIAMAFAIAMLYLAFSERRSPSKRTYLVLGILSVLTLVVGVLFTAVIALLGAGIGYWETRNPAGY